MSQRPRHRYAVDLPCDLRRRQLKTSREVPAASTADEMHRARPKSARLESVSRFRTQQRRFLTYSSSSRSPDPHHL